nr:hypothetical protein [Tanacetum cinerariifolium]
SKPYRYRGNNVICNVSVRVGSVKSEWVGILVGATWTGLWLQPWTMFGFTYIFADLATRPRLWFQPSLGNDSTLVKTNDDSHKEEPEVGEQEVEYFNIFPTRSEPTYNKYLMLSQVALGRPFVEIFNIAHDPPEGVVRNDEDRRRGAEYVMSMILGFYKECIELGPEYVTEMDDEGEVTIAWRKFLIKNKEEIFTDTGDGVRIYPDGIASPAWIYLTRRSLEDLRMFLLDDSWRTL